MCHITDGMTMSMYGMIIIRMRVIPHEKSPFLLLFNDVRTEIDGNSYFQPQQWKRSLNLKNV